MPSARFVLTWKLLLLWLAAALVVKELARLAAVLWSCNHTGYLELRERLEGPVGGRVDLQEGEVALAEIAPRHDSFFLVETSGRPALDPKELCTVESAARHHPNNTIYVLMTSPTLQWSPLIADVVADNPNVNFKHLNFESFVMGSPLEGLWTRGKVQGSDYMVSHLSDVLRWLVLERYGGTYLDLDQVVVRPFPEDLPNFIAQEHPKHISVGVIRLQPHHPLAKSVVSALGSRFDGKDFSSNGPGLATEVFKQFCSGNNKSLPLLVERSLELCQGVRVFPKEVFYPVRWQDWEDIFKPDTKISVLSRLTDATLSVHTWGTFSRGERPDFGNSDIAFSHLASTHCPMVFKSGGKL